MPWQPKGINVCWGVSSTAQLACWSREVVVPLCAGAILPWVWCVMSQEILLGLFYSTFCYVYFRDQYVICMKICGFSLSEIVVISVRQETLWKYAFNLRRKEESKAKRRGLIKLNWKTEERWTNFCNSFCLITSCHCCHFLDLSDKIAV